MKFIIIYKKEDNDFYDDSFLSSIKAPSLIANNYIKKEISNFTTYLYLYNQVYDENKNFYEYDDENLNFYNGLITTQNSNKLPTISEIFNAIECNDLILGDFQAIHLDKNNNCYIKTSDSSIYPLFYYEDEQGIVLSNELKLIVDGINAFRTTDFVNNYDYDFIEEIFYKGFFYKKPKKHYRKTIFKNIERILPHDEIDIKNGVINIKKNSSITVPKWFEEWYLEDKESLYDWYYDELMKYTETLIKYIEHDVEEIRAGITGGFDSRITLMVLNKFCKKYNIRLNTHTNGESNHPDVVIGEKVANVLGFSWRHAVNENNLKRTPQTFQEYASTFYESQGDFDSHDFVTYYTRDLNSKNSFFQNGMDVYKRDSMSSIINFNRWFSRRKLFDSSFYFPLLSTNLELWFSRIYEKFDDGNDLYKEFVYYVLKKGEPELLEIPFAFESLPQLNIEEYKSEGYSSTLHKLQNFLWDYEFVYKELDPLFKIKFNKVDSQHEFILSKNGINSLDYFLLKDKIDSLLKDKSNNGIDKKLRKYKNKSFYPLTRTYINLDKCSSKSKSRSLMKLMDYASAASFSSFVSLEQYVNFNGSDDKYDSKEEIYIEYDELLSKFKKIKKLNKDITSSRSYKLVTPLKKLKIYLNKIGMRKK